MKKKRKVQHGGRRAGAGRPPAHDEPTRNVTLRLPESLVDSLDVAARAAGVSRTQIVIARCRETQPEG